MRSDRPSGKDRGADLATPGAVARRAHLAANRGRFAEANRCVVPTLVEEVSRIGPTLRAAQRALDRADKLDGPTRGNIQATLDKARRFAQPNFCWNAMTRNRSLVSVAITREVIKGDRATVHLTLRLTNGDVRTERERLVRTRGGWLLGDPEDCTAEDRMPSNPRPRRSAAATGGKRTNRIAARRKHGGR
jgi:hypothetical protein